MKNRCHPIANALELCLYCIKTLLFGLDFYLLSGMNSFHHAELVKSHGQDIGFNLIIDCFKTSFLLFLLHRLFHSEYICCRDKVLKMI